MGETSSFREQSLGNLGKMWDEGESKNFEIQILTKESPTNQAVSKRVAECGMLFDLQLSSIGHFGKFLRQRGYGENATRRYTTIESKHKSRVQWGIDAIKAAHPATMRRKGMFGRADKDSGRYDSEHQEET